MKPQKQYGDFSSYPYPLSDEDRAVIERVREHIRVEALAAFHASEKECDSGI